MSSRAPRYWLAAALLVALGLAIRIYLGLEYPNRYWPDEIFQTLEPAHAWAFGNGKLTWEFQEGARNWLFPGLLGVVMQWTAPLGAGSYGYLTGIVFLLSGLSLLPALVSHGWAAREQPSSANLLALVPPLFWMELVYFAPKALYEVFTAHLLVAAIFLVRFDRGRWWLAWAGGVLLGLGCICRIQLAPAVVALTLVLPVFADQPHAHFSALVTGFAVGFGVGGALDWVTWGTPFQSVVVNYHANIVEGKAQEYGTKGTWAYVGWMWEVSPSGTAILAVVTAAGLLRHPALAWPALALFAAHSAVAHKEYRFVYPVIVLATVAAGLEMSALLDRARERLPRPAAATVGALLAVGVVGVSARAAWTFDLKSRGGHTAETNWTHYRGQHLAFRSVSARPEICGVGIIGVHWTGTAGFAYLHRDVPLLQLDDVETLERRADHVDVVVAPDWREERTPPGDFRVDRCRAGTCILVRAGGCEPPPRGVGIERRTRLTNETGGGGGDPYAWRCPAGSVVTGLRGELTHAGDRPQHVRVDCRRLVSREGSLATGTEVESSPAFGDEGGGEPFEVTCEEDRVAAGLVGRSGALIDAVGLLCADLRPDGRLHRFRTHSIEAAGSHGGSGGSSFRLTCPRPTAMQGVRGRTGVSIDAVGIDCWYLDSIRQNTRSDHSPDD